LAVSLTLHHQQAAADSLVTRFKAPVPYPADRCFTVFLGGSIEMGAAGEWQADVFARLAAAARSTDPPIRCLDPRRESWDSSWEQKMENPQFREQVGYTVNPGWRSAARLRLLALPVVHSVPR
jgi:hypothetical protein